MLDRHSVVPLHDQLRAAIEQRIESGEWLPHAQLPSERELCDRFQVSRITVRQAIGHLVAAGRLTRRQGRGTYVAASPFRKFLVPLVGFSEDMRARGLRPGARVLRFEATVPAPSVAAALRLGKGERTVVLRRLRLANEEPVALETVHLPERLCPDILQESLENRSLYELLRGRYGIRIARADQQWQAVACPAGDARLLGVRAGSPVLRIERVTHDVTETPFEYLESYFRGDRYIFSAELRETDLLREGEPAQGSAQARSRTPDSEMRRR